MTKTDRRGNTILKTLKSIYKKESYEDDPAIYMICPNCNKGHEHTYEDVLDKDGDAAAVALN